MAHIERLFVYPVKSCEGMDVPVAEIGLRGPRFDREFALVGEDGLALTQRAHPRMALVAAEIRVGMLTVRMPGAKDLCLPLDDGVRPVRRIEIWEDQCQGADVGDEAAEAFSGFLGAPCRLVQYIPSHPRLRDSTTLGRKVPVGFADAYPLLVVSEASLADLNSRCPERITMDRFRPNIVLADVPAYEEDTVAEIMVGNVRLQGANQCERCVVTTTNQQTGERGVEPLRTLAGYRKNAAGKVVFGRNFVPTTTGSISVGDRIRLVARSA